MLACQPLQRTEGEPLASRLIGTKLGTSKIPFFLTGEGKEGKVSRAFLRESINGVNQYVTFLLPQYRIRNEMPNWQRKTVTFWNEKDILMEGHSNGGTNVGLWRGLQAYFMMCHATLDNLRSLGCSGSLSM